MTKDITQSIVFCIALIIVGVLMAVPGTLLLTNLQASLHTRTFAADMTVATVLAVVGILVAGYCGVVLFQLYHKRAR